MQNNHLIVEYFKNLKTRSIIELLGRLAQVFKDTENYTELSTEERNRLLMILQGFYTGLRDHELVINLRPEHYLDEFSNYTIPEWFSNAHPVPETNKQPTSKEIEKHKGRYIISGLTLLDRIIDCMCLIDIESNKNEEKSKLIAEELGEDFHANLNYELTSLSYLLALVDLNINHSESLLIYGMDNPLKEIRLLPRQALAYSKGHVYLVSRTNEFVALDTVLNMAYQAKDVIVSLKIMDESILVHPSTLALITQASNFNTTLHILIQGDPLNHLTCEALGLSELNHQELNNVRIYYYDKGLEELLAYFDLAQNEDGYLVHVEQTYEEV